MGIQIERLNHQEAVYDITVQDNENFFANGILVHNCAEIDLPTKPLQDINDPNGEISLCTLAAINIGLINHPSDFEEYADLAVRALDELLDYQEYPIIAAQNSTMKRRPLGIGIINLAFFLAKRGLKYHDNSGIDAVHEYTEAWSYYLIKASVNLAKEKGACPGLNETKYGQGLMPIDTYKKEVDEVHNSTLKMDWEELRSALKKHGIRNSTLMACMPAETSAQISNSTNGIEPPRHLVSYKASKDGVMAQVVPSLHRYRKSYDLLWDQQSPEGYLNICGVLQKFIDQGISVNTSYVPKFFEGGKVPMSHLLQDIFYAYKLGIKQLYYSNTDDGSGDVDDEAPKDLKEDEDEDADEICDSCAI